MPAPRDETRRHDHPPRPPPRLVAAAGPRGPAAATSRGGGRGGWSCRLVSSRGAGIPRKPDATVGLTAPSRYTENAVPRARRPSMKYVCIVCAYVYDPEVGDPDNGIEPGTACLLYTSDAA